MFKACLLCATHFQLQISFYILLVSKKFGMCQTQYILETGQATSMKCPYTYLKSHTQMMFLTLFMTTLATALSQIAQLLISNKRSFMHYHIVPVEKRPLVDRLVAK